MTDASVWIPKEDSICSKCNEHQYLTEFLISIVQNMSGNPSVPHEVLWLVQLMVLAVQGVTHFVFLHYRGGSCLQDSQFGGKKSFPLSAAPCWYPAQEHLVSLDILSLQWFFRQNRNVVSCSELPSQRRYKLILSSDFDTIHTEKPNNTQGGKKRREFKKQTQTWLTEHTPWHLYHTIVLGSFKFRRYKKRCLVQTPTIVTLSWFFSLLICVK